jgi:hypothetical protein
MDSYVIVGSDGMREIVDGDGEIEIGLVNPHSLSPDAQAMLAAMQTMSLMLPAGASAATMNAMNDARVQLMNAVYAAVGLPRASGALPPFAQSGIPKGHAIDWRKIARAFVR